MSLPDQMEGGRESKDRLGNVERDVMALSIAAAAVIMFVGTGSAVVPAVVASFAGVGIGPDIALVNALLLNVALIIFGWRRYRELSREVGERRRAERQARAMAETDPLTGTLNRRSFSKAFESMKALANAQGRSIAIMMIDLDNFKRVNDLKGHGVGDQILIECTRRISRVLPSGALLSRIGGDEFACAMDFDCDNSVIVDNVAAAIIDTIRAPADIDGVHIEITASIGITRTDTILRERDAAQDQPVDAKHMLDMADVAMYHAKKQGRNSYFWFENHMAEEMQFRARIEAGMRNGLEKGEFVPFYEQQIDVVSGKVTGFEMLARWNSPEFGLVLPDMFIPVAEDAGLISDMSERLIAMALEDAKEWDAQLTLAVNISPVQLRDPWFSQKLLKLLVNASFPPGRLEVEITESCVHEDVVQVRSLIASLKNQGIRVSLDDFGTGYSSLGQLQTLPFDRIKIDRSFVTNLANCKDSAAIVHSIALLGKGLGLPITAEGIENNEVLAQLRDYGEMRGLGYLYGHPRSAGDTRRWLEAQGLIQTLNSVPQPEISRPTPMSDLNDPEPLVAKS